MNTFEEDDDSYCEDEFVSLDEFLPVEIKLDIFKFLPIPNLFKLAQVCKRWHNLLMVSDTTFWQSIALGSIKKMVIFDNVASNMKEMHWRKLSKFLWMKEMAARAHFEIVSKEREEDEENPKHIYEEDEEDITSTFKERTLIYKGVKESSFDMVGQGIDQTRNGRNRRSFWSSKGSDTPSASEYLIYQIQDPIFIAERETKIIDSKHCPVTKLEKFYKHIKLSDRAEPMTTVDLNAIDGNSTIGVIYIEKLTVCPFVAAWQNSTCYPPKFVSLSIGKTIENLDSASYEKLTENIPIEHNGSFQQFAVGPIVVLYSRQPQRPETKLTPQAVSQIVEEPNVQPEEEMTFEEEDEEFEDVSSDDETPENVVRSTITDEDIYLALNEAGGVIGEEFYNHLRSLMMEKVKARSEELREQMLLSKMSLSVEPGDLLIKMDLIGKTSVQPIDNLYYSCLEFVDVTGSGFTL